MTIAAKLRDPTAETSPTRRARLVPPPSLDGKTVALMDIGKARGAEFLDRLEGHFKAAGVATRRYRKPTNKLEVFGNRGKLHADQHGLKVYLSAAQPGLGLRAGWNSQYITELFSSVPFFVFDGKYAVAGAQDPAAFADVLKQTHNEKAPIA